MFTFYEEYLDKIRDDQLRYDANHPTDPGALPDVVPYDGIGGEPGCPIWSVAYIVIARNVLKYRGDDAIPMLQKHYSGLEDLMGWFDRHADPSDGLLVTKCYGDWMGFNPGSKNGGSSSLTPTDLVTAFHHVLGKQFMSDIASALGNTTGALAWAKDAKELVGAFHKRYYSPVSGGYAPCSSNCYGTSANGSQTSNALALYLNAPPDNETLSRVQNNLVADIRAFGNKTTCGITGMAFLFDALEAANHGVVGLDILQNDGYPSMGWFAHQNMTTLCENLACTFHDNGGGSQNHIMFGGFDAWLVSYVGGLHLAGSGRVNARVTSAALATALRSETPALKAALAMPGFGEATLEWSLDATKRVVSGRLVVPVGAKASLSLPVETSSGATILGSGVHPFSFEL